jgi:multimeric flavodoxin WrbA
MKYLVVSASPNFDGLTAACAETAAASIRDAGHLVDEIRLNDLSVGMCEACGNGWGTCLDHHICQVEDDFQALHTKTIQADGLVLVTPVYWGEMSESAKAFTDRVRRCEANFGENSRLAGKPVLAVAAAGGSGGGMITCLQSMERWILHVHARTFDLIPVNRWSRAYKLETIRAAALAMASNSFDHLSESE